MFYIKQTADGGGVARPMGIEVVEVSRKGHCAVPFGNPDLLDEERFESGDVHLRDTFGHVREHPLERTSDALVEVWIFSFAGLFQPFRLLGE